MIAMKAAGGILIVCLLAGCAGSGISLTDSPTAAAQQPQPVGMSGRWILSAPNAPSCGMRFGGAMDAKEGSIAPEGGCPAKFYTSRRWVKTDTGLTINDDQGAPLAQLSPATGGGFEGQSTSGMPVTLTR
jgi:Protease inhibitor Inh